MMLQTSRKHRHKVRTRRSPYGSNRVGIDAVGTCVGPRGALIQVS